MSDLGLQPAAQPGGRAASDRARPAVTPTEKPSSDIPIWVVLVAILVMLAMAAATAFILLRESDEREYPARWDSRVAPYVQIAQRERGVFFMHPVAVRFLPPAEFEKSIAGDEKELSPEDRTEIEQFTGLKRAFGLLTGDVDLFEAVNDFSTGGLPTTRSRTNGARFAGRG